MIKCPRCNLQQEASPQCEYCGLIFSEFVEFAPTSKTAFLKRTSLLVLILIVAGALLAASWFIFSGHKSGEKTTISKSTSFGEQKTKENDLRATAEELSGDAGIINSLMSGSSKGNIIAMVFFSIIGIGYFTYGKKSQRLLMVICGIALMGYSYFVDGTVYIILIGAGLSALPFILGRK